MSLRRSVSDAVVHSPFIISRLLLYAHQCSERCAVSPRSSPYGLLQFECAQREQQGELQGLRVALAFVTPLLHDKSLALHSCGSAIVAHRPALTTQTLCAPLMTSPYLHAIARSRVVSRCCAWWMWLACSTQRCASRARGRGTDGERREPWAGNMPGKLLLLDMLCLARLHTPGIRHACSPVPGEQSGVQSTSES